MSHATASPSAVGEHYLSLRMCAGPMDTDTDAFEHDVRGIIILSADEFADVTIDTEGSKFAYNKKALAVYAFAAFGLPLCDQSENGLCGECFADGMEDDTDIKFDSARMCLPLCVKVTEIGRAFAKRAPATTSQVLRPNPEIVKMLRAEQRLRESLAAADVAILGAMSDAEGGDTLRVRLRIVEAAEARLAAARGVHAAKTRQREDVRANLAALLTTAHA
jgi:hypothetical protein